jgi:hypothetical protein
VRWGLICAVYGYDIFIFNFLQEEFSGWVGRMKGERGGEMFGRRVEGGEEWREGGKGLGFGGKRHAKDLEMSIECREMGNRMCKMGLLFE